MRILPVKTESDFQNVKPPEGTVLLWPQVDQNNTVVLHVKNSDGNVSTISGGGSGAYYPGYGISIDGDTIAVNESVVAMKEDLNHLALSNLTDIGDLTGAQDGQSLVYDAASAKWQPGAGGGGSVNVYPAVATADAVTDETTGITTVKVRKVKITASGTEYDSVEQTLICGWPAPIEGA